MHLLLLDLVCCSLPAEEPVKQIPALQGETFAGNRVSLPDSFGGKPAILVIGFTQASRDAVTKWGEWLARDAPAVAYYEIPVLTSVPKMLRGFVLGRIKAAVAEAARPHFVPLLDHEAEWQRIAEYSNADDAYVLLVDGRGYVLWQMHGPPTEPVRMVLMHDLAAASQQATLLPSR